MLETLGQRYSAVVVGASGGIGRQFVDRLAAGAACERLFAFSRTAVDVHDEKVISHNIDVLDEATIARAAQVAGRDIGLVIVATGILHRGSHLRPEKAMREVSADRLREVIDVNTIGPTLVAKHFLPLLRREHKSVFAALSARVGSIGDNRLGGWISYRASKAALNMSLRTLSIEHARRHPNSVVAGLHPGTVRTPLSEPFSARVPAGKLFSAAQSVDHMLEVIDGLTPQDSGGVFAWDGQRIPS